MWQKVWFRFVFMVPGLLQSFSSCSLYGRLVKESVHAVHDRQLSTMSDLTVLPGPF